MEFDAVIRRRRMHRSFSEEPVATADVLSLCESALRAPSAGFTQGTELVVIADPDRIEAILATISTPGWLRNSPTHQGLLQSQLLILPIVNKPAYLARYAEPDKASSGLDAEEAWPQPYWIVDASFATMQLLLKVVDLGLGATFMGIYYGHDQLAKALALPPGLDPLGIVCVGHPTQNNAPTGSVVRRPPRATSTRLHFEHW
ncbi:MAG: nitroreductase family protein [Ferrimicrobium sp.]|nr:nitroreductase family protein [Ferrimicrobium sp.]